MKRSGPPQRRTPLKQGKGLSRGQGLHSGPWPSASKPIKPKRDRSIAARHDPSRAEDEKWADVRLIIFARSLGRCEVCDRQLNIAAMEGHHRRSRSVRGEHRHCPCNALAVCSTCHHEGIHRKPTQAGDLGRILSKLSTTPPGDVAVVLHRGRTFLTCGGTYLDAA